MYAPFDLSRKTVLVTGANAGIGLGMAEALAAAGATLIIWGRRVDRNEAAAERLRRHGVRVTCQGVDISDEAAVEHAFGQALATHDVIDAVFANAGRSGGRDPFDRLDTATLEEVIATNQLGTTFTLRAAAAHMVAVANRGNHPPGSLVITGSSSMLWGVAGNACYAMTKGALDALCRTLAVEYGKYGIRVNCLLPGLIESEFAHTPATTAWIESNCSMKRGGGPAEMGGIAVYLASDASSYHTGTSIVIDGGLSIQRGAA
jgi:NAD(P)-dependent dehydrogenase (short-subunit alcohol dehydrogenase family)